MIDRMYKENKIDKPVHIDSEGSYNNCKNHPEIVRNFNIKHLFVF